MLDLEILCVSTQMIGDIHLNLLSHHFRVIISFMKSLGRQVELFNPEDQ